jgi:sigma-B regulation protein RsbU (phosphoserine phosphatase)
MFSDEESIALNPSHSLRRPALRGLALVVVAIALAYGAVWMYSVRWQPAGDLGLQFVDGSLEIARIEHKGPAEAAGMKPYDRLIDLNGRPVTTQLEVLDALRSTAPGTPVRMTVRLAGLGGRPRSYDLTMGPREEAGAGSPLGVVARELARSYPALLVLLIAAVLFLRPERVESWLVAATMAGMIATAPLMSFLQQIPPGMRGFAVTVKVVAWAVAPGLLYYLLAVFPEASPLDRRLPWLKSAWPALSMIVAMIFCLWLRASGIEALVASSLPETGLWLGWLSWIAALGLGLTSLVSTYLETRSNQVERTLRVIACGFVVALGPALVVKILSVLARGSVGDLGVWLWFPAFVALLALPVALGYAVSSREVLDLPVIARRVARLLLVQRGGAIALLSVVGTIAGLGTAEMVAALTESRAGWTVSGLLCAALVAGGGIVLQHRFADRIDCALFGDDHRTRRILEDLEAQIRTMTDVDDLAARLEQQIEEALFPSSFALYLAEGESLKIARGNVEREQQEIPLSQPLVPLDDAGPNGTPRLAPIGSLNRVTRLGPDCLVPIAGASSLVGLLVLGPRRSDEPYSGEDLRLLLTTAKQVGQLIEKTR